MRLAFLGFVALLACGDGEPRHAMLTFNGRSPEELTRELDVAACVDVEQGRLRMLSWCGFADRQEARAFRTCEPCAQHLDWYFVDAREIGFVVRR